MSPTRGRCRGGSPRPHTPTGGVGRRSGEGSEKGPRSVSRPALAVSRKGWPRADSGASPSPACPSPARSSPSPLEAVPKTGEKERDMTGAGWRSTATGVPEARSLRVRRTAAAVRRVELREGPASREGGCGAPHARSGVVGCRDEVVVGGGELQVGHFAHVPRPGGARAAVGDVSSCGRPLSLSLRGGDPRSVNWSSPLTQLQTLGRAGDMSGTCPQVRPALTAVEEAPEQCLASVSQVSGSKP